MNTEPNSRLMRWWANCLKQKHIAWSVIVISVIVSGIGAFGALKVERDDDLLAFLPKPNADVETFYQINKKFGGLDVAIVGIEAPNLFSEKFLGQLSRVTKSLDELPVTESALSITNVQTFRPAEGGGIETAFLVNRIPKTEQEIKALRKRVMGEELVVGELISKKANAVLVYCFSSFGSDPKLLAEQVQAIVEKEIPNLKKYYGGAPFINSYIYQTTQDDLQSLTPWSVAVIVLLILIAFRDIFGAGLALLSTGMGIAISMGAMGLLGIKYNIVLSSMPVILFAIGSAYGIHMLARYYQLRAKQEPQAALEAAMVSVGPVIIGAGLTTVAGLVSFVAMDIEPMRTFGVFTALGIFVTLVFSVTLIPAVISVLGLKAKNASAGAFSAKIAALSMAAHRKRIVFGIALLAVMIAGSFFAGRVETRMDHRSFFEDGSPPDLADDFLRENFGGSVYVQLRLHGDFTQPGALREVQALSDQIELLDGVASVKSISEVIAEVNKAMDGVRRVPFTSDQAKSLYGFLAGNTAVTQLVSADRKEAVIHAKLSVSDGKEVEERLEAIEKLAKLSSIRDYQFSESAAEEALQRYVRDRIRVLAGRKAIPLSTESIDAGILQPVSEVESVPIQVAIEKMLLSEEAIIEFPPPAAQSVSEVVAALPEGANSESIAAVISPFVIPLAEDDEEPSLLVQDVADSLEAPLKTFRLSEKARLRAKKIINLGEHAELEIALTDALTSLNPPSLERKKRNEKFSLEVSGLPVLHRGMSASVIKNQFKSLSMALGLVWILLSIMFRSLWTGLLASSPTIVTLLVIYGGMGWLGVSLDIGTSMLASIIIGAGVDYAVHLISEWRSKDDQPSEWGAKHAVSATGPAIWTNAFMVAAGFYVLTLGQAKALQNVGWLTCCAMLVAAIATFLTIPVLARKRRYR